MKSSSIGRQIPFLVSFTFSLFITVCQSGAADLTAVNNSFISWNTQYQQASVGQKNELIDSGIALARERRTLLIDSIRADPEKAILTALSEDELLVLPAEIQKLCERHVKGDAADSRFFAAPLTSYEPTRREIMIRGQTFAGYVYGGYSAKTSFQGCQIKGVAVGPYLAVESPKLYNAVASLSALPPPTQTTIEMTINIDPAKATLLQSGQFSRLTYPGCKPPQDAPGSPLLPSLFTNVYLPRNAIITDVRVTGTPEQTLQTNVLLYPTQPPIVQGQTTAFVPPDPAIYDLSGPYPVTAGDAVGDPIRSLSYSFVSIRISPFRYMPSSRSVVFHDTISVTISYCLPPESRVEGLNTPIQSVLGADDTQYLIITSTSFSNEFARLADNHAKFDGFSTAVITVESITAQYSGLRPDGESDTQTSIRECIADFVNNHGTSCVLLGGDETIVPVRNCFVESFLPWHSTYEMSTDFYYAGLDGSWDENSNGVYGEVDYNIFYADEGDLGADVQVGRLPINSLVDATAYINKVIEYNTHPPYATATKLLIGGKHLGNLTGSGGDYLTYTNDDRPSDALNDGHRPFRDSLHPNVSDAEMWGRRLFRDCIQPVYIPSQLGYLFDTLTTQDGDNSLSSVIAGSSVLNPALIHTTLNEGWGTFLYMSHGSVSGWSTENLNPTNGAFGDDLTDLHTVTPVMFGTACDTSLFVGFRCLADKLLTMPSAGCLAYIAASRDALLESDPPPAEGNSIGGTMNEWAGQFCGFAFSHQPFLVVTAASALYQTKEYFAPQATGNVFGIGNNHRWTFFSLNLLGDPVLQLIRHIPPAKVSIEATDAVASETGSDKAEFTIRRVSADCSSPLTVHYEVSGSGIQGQDYSSVLSGQVTIPASQTSVKIQIDPIVDTLLETDKTLVLNLRRDVGWIDEANYMVDGQSQATVVMRGEVTVTTNAGQATITGYTGQGGVVIIPSTINGLPVTIIGNSAFYNCTNLTSVTIPNSVTAIGDNTFAGCSRLTSVSLGENMTSIGNWTFSNCIGLPSLTIPVSVTNIGVITFNNCVNLTAIHVNAANGSYSSNDGILFNKSQTQLIRYPSAKTGSFYSIPATVTNVPTAAFASCSRLVGIEIPASVRYLESRPFGSCPALTSITVDAANPNYSSDNGVLFNKARTTLIQCPMSKTGNYSLPTGVTNINTGAFAQCFRLTSVTIPLGVTRIENDTFSGCRGVTSMAIPDSVKIIGDRAFSYCTSLTSVTLGNGVYQINSYAFSSCTNLTSVLFTGNAPLMIYMSPFASTPATLYYLPTATPPTFAGRPTLLWNPTVQHDDNFGFVYDNFGFNIAGTTNIPILIESRTNLSAGGWTPFVTTNLDISGSFHFTDPSSSTHPAHFYRVTFPK